MKYPAMRWLGAASLTLINACSTLPPLPAELSAMAANQQLEHWQLSGKIGIRNGKQGHSAYLNWQQCGDQYSIKLTGPLGQGAAHLSGNKRQAVLKTSDNRRFHSSSAAALLEQHFGWQLPVNQLRYWIRGIPSPKQRYQALPAGDLAAGFRQQGWQLNYSKVMAVENFQLPAKASAVQSPLKVTLVINNWQLLPDCKRDS